MTGSEVLLDSSVWLDYFLNASEKSREYVNSAGLVLYSSVISLHEVKKKLLKDSYDGEKINISLGFMKKRAVNTRSENTNKASRLLAFLDLGNTYFGHKFTGLIIARLPFIFFTSVDKCVV